MKKTLCILLLSGSFLYAQNATEMNPPLQEISDSMPVQPKHFALGVKLGMPNIVGGSVEIVLPVLNNHLAPYADISGFDINPDDDTQVAMSYSEFGLNYYFGQEGKGLYLSAGLGNLTTDLTFSNIEVEDDNGFSVNDGVGTIEENIATTNFKIGIKTGGRFYFRFELGYGFGDIPSDLVIQATSPSLGESDTITEPFPEIPGVSDGGVVIGNIGFGISF
ncbi:MAG: hypothetical protein ACON47_05900 [Flavobacteriaceae bacterium]